MARREEEPVGETPGHWGPGGLLGGGAHPLLRALSPPSIARAMSAPGVPMALKVMHARFSAASTALRPCSRREAETLKRLRHPHVREQSSTGGALPDGRPFIAMEWLEGRGCWVRNLALRRPLSSGRGAGGAGAGGRRAPSRAQGGRGAPEAESAERAWVRLGQREARRPYVKLVDFQGIAKGLVPGPRADFCDAFRPRCWARPWPRGAESKSAESRRMSRTRGTCMRWECSSSSS